MHISEKEIRIKNVSSDFEREKLMRPFGFKGNYLTELWQVASMLQSDSGQSQTGLATQSVLYGDSDLFSSCSEASGNALMYTLTSKTLSFLKSLTFKNPVSLMEEILPYIIKQGIEITGNNNLNTNFIYNSLVSVDNALWLLYAAENGLSGFDEMLPFKYRNALQSRNQEIAVMYQIPYNMPAKDIVDAVKKGYFIFKIKTGYPGSQEQMLEKDMERLFQIHTALKDLNTTKTSRGKILYTMDANGRYEKKETLQKYLDYAKKIDALEHILLYEEPFSEDNTEDVSDIEVKIAADESANDIEGTLRRIEQGYKVIVLKSIAKTLSLTLKIAKLAKEKNVSCFCADLTVNPILIDWNKNLSARLEPFPEINMGLMETNGDMNYMNWKNMQNYHPFSGTSWTSIKDGVFYLNEDFYKYSGGIFEPSEHYTNMFMKR